MPLTLSRSNFRREPCSLYSLPRHLQFLGYVSGFRWSYCFRKAFPDHLSYVISSRLGVLYLVGGRVHLDDSESHRKGRSEMPFYLSEAPLVLREPGHA
ncbi:hypothetical protein TNCV_1911551 [Trichonephila clavipes]|nr:hypothetical protein TNCV_1911551 [Trichonephila clavipes]